MIPAILRRRRYSLLWLSVILLLGLLLAWLVSVPLLRGQPIGRSGTLVGQPAPALEAPDLDGRDWTLADAGNRITWVNFWATSCEPCRTEMPAMQRIAEEYANELMILGVNWGEDAGSVADFAERYGVTYPILLDPGLDVYYDWAGTDGLPRHYFIGQSGTILREVIGPLDPTRMVEIVDELLAESAWTAKTGRAVHPVIGPTGSGQPPTTTDPFISGWMSHWK